MSRLRIAQKTVQVIKIMAIYETRRSTATPFRTLLGLRLVDLVLRIAEWQAARRTRKLVCGLDGHLLKDASLRRDDLGRF